MSLINSFFEAVTPKDEEVAKRFYDKTHSCFNLPSRWDIKDQNFWPYLSVTWSNKTIQTFTLQSDRIEPAYFTETGTYNLLTTLDREMPTHSHQRYCYDVSRLHEGILTAQQMPENSKEIQASDQNRAILEIIGALHFPKKTKVPFVQVKLGEKWDTYRIPDFIQVQIFGILPYSENQFNELAHAIAHKYNMLDNPHVEIELHKNISSGKILMEAKTKDNFPYEEYRNAGIINAENNISVQMLDGTIEYIPANSDLGRQHLLTYTEKQNNTQATEDNFPYDYYKSIGLIDEEGKVLVSSILGPMRIPADSEQGREYLLNYKPEA